MTPAAELWVGPVEGYPTDDLEPVRLPVVENAAPSIVVEELVEPAEHVAAMKRPPAFVRCSGSVAPYAIGTSRMAIIADLDAYDEVL